MSSIGSFALQYQYPSIFSLLASSCNIQSGEFTSRVTFGDKLFNNNRGRHRDASLSALRKGFALDKLINHQKGTCVIWLLALTDLKPIRDIFAHSLSTARGLGREDRTRSPFPFPGAGY